MNFYLRNLFEKKKEEEKRKNWQTASGTGRGGTYLNDGRDKVVVFLIKA